MKVEIGDYKDDGSERDAEIRIEGYDLYSLDHTLALIIAPALKAYRSEPVSYPCDMTKEEWLRIVDSMIFAFDYINEEDKDPVYSKEREELCLDGLVLFGKYFRALWQ